MIKTNNNQITNEELNVTQSNQLFQAILKRR